MKRTSDAWRQAAHRKGLAAGLARDFTSDTALIRAAFPDETAGMTVLGRFMRGDQERLKEWIEGASPGMRDRIKADHADKLPHDATAARIAHVFAANEPPGILADGGNVLLWAPHRRDMHAPDAAPGAVRKKSRLIFFHEAGHIVVPDIKSIFMDRLRLGLSFNNKKTDDRIQGRKEIEGDTFAAMFGLKLGFADRADVEALSTERALNACLTGTATHATSLALDSLLLSRSDAGFRSLLPREIQAVARAHGKKFALGGKTQKMQKAFWRAAKRSGMPVGISLSDTRQEHRQKWLENLAEYCAAAPAKSPEFYITAKALSSILSRGRVDYMMQSAFDTGRPVLNDTREIIAARAKSLGMERALNPYAAKGAAP